MVTLRVKKYLTVAEVSPFDYWLLSLDKEIQSRISVRLIRFTNGNLGDVKQVGDGVWEAKFSFGPGYRMYFGKSEGNMIILLMGGNKKTQSKDIKIAKTYWLDFLRRLYEKKII